MADSPEKKEQLEIPLPAQYFSTMRVSHTKREFFFDFAQMIPGTELAVAFARLVTSPAHAKEMARALTENVKRYEASFDEIPAESQTKPVSH